jgi:5-formyltetrahydrofolate cyclo-ligase
VPDFAREAEKSRSAKVSLRNQLLTMRRTLSSADRLAAAVAVQTATTDLVRRLTPSSTAAYVPVGTEPGGPDLPDVLLAALPDLDLDWAVHPRPRSPAPGSSGHASAADTSALGPVAPGGLAAGPRGLREPIGDRVGVDAVRHVDLLIVPALAVDRSGVRLGRGGGSYDRVLSRAGAAWIVALLHDGELLDAVPAEQHDRPVHAVITPADGLIILRDPPVRSEP